MVSNLKLTYVLQGPTMKFHFFILHELNSVLPATRSPISTVQFYMGCDGGFYVADIWLLKNIQFCLKPKISTKNLHEWGLGEADRAEI